MEKTNASGIHRAPLWRIGGFALNNTATNLYMFLMNFIAYYLTGFVGVGVVLASSFTMMMRIWDGVTDPFIGYMVDKTNTRFGKNRPFIVAGNLILLIGSFILLHVTHLLPDPATTGINIRFFFFVIIYMIYIIGYTFQCVVTKSAQTCLTNDPRQRPLFSIFDGIYNTLLFSFMPIFFTGTLMKKYGGFTQDYFHEAWLVTAALSLVFSCIAIFSISSKDRVEYFGIGKPVKVGFRDYWEVLKSNRAIQMLVVSASTDKLALTSQSNAVVGVILFGIVCGNYAMQGASAAYTTIPVFLFLLFGIGFIATHMGQRKAMLLGTYGGLVCCILSFLLFYVADPTTLSFPGFDNFNGWNFFTLGYLVLWIGFKGFSGIAGNIVIPMTADCADYEVYRSGRYVPGLMGTLFSAVDKIISSLASTIVGLMCAMIGFTSQLPTVDTPYSAQLKFVGLFGMYGLTIIGYLANIIAMHYYPLTREKMAEIQSEIAAIKAKAKGEQA